MPDHLMLDMTAEDDFVMDQRAISLLSLKDSCPPPRKFSPASSLNRMTRALSVDSSSSRCKVAAGRLQSQSKFDDYFKVCDL